MIIFVCPSPAQDWALWVYFSVYACEGLVDDDVLQTWNYYRQGYLIHARGNMTQESRADAAEAFKKYGQGCERHLGITACTIATHLTVVEADFQIDFVGPVPEAKASWIERLNLRIVEPVRRRRVCHSPEKAICRGYLLELFVDANRDSIIALEDPRDPRTADDNLYDAREQEPKMLGKGETYTLTTNELAWVKTFVSLNHGNDIALGVPAADVVLFKRALFRTELHSKQYTGVRSRRSHDVAIRYEQGIYYGVVEKFFIVKIGSTILRLALVTAYGNVAPTAAGVLRINRNRPFALGRVVNLECIEEKVILVGPMNPCKVLQVPRSLSHR